MRNNINITLYDYGRALLSVIVPLLLNLQNRLDRLYLFIGALFFIYSIGILIFRKYIPTVKYHIKFLIIIDTVLISLMLFLTPNNSALNFLYLIQLFGLSVSYGLPEILTAFYFQSGTHIVLEFRTMAGLNTEYQFNEFITVFYFLIVVILLSKAWGNERRANREMLSKLTRKIQNIRDTYEISKILSFSEAGTDLKQVICRVTLEDLEVDAGAVFIGYGEDFKLLAALKIPEDIQQKCTDYEFIKFLRELSHRMEPLIINDISNVEKAMDYPLFSETLNHYSSVLVYPSERNFVSQVVIAFSRQPGYFTGEKIDACKKILDKSMFTFAILQDNDDLQGDKQEDEQEVLLSNVSALLARLFRAEKCIIALFDGEEKITVKGYFGDSKFKVGMALDYRDQIIYLTKIKNQAVLVEEHMPQGLKKFNGVKFSNLISVPVSCGISVTGMITVINKQDENFLTYKNFDKEDQLLLTLIANQLGLAIENKQLFTVQKDTFITTIRSLVQALDARDPYTKGHSEQVSKYAEMIALEMGLSDPEIENIRFAGLLHDIGKIGIPEKVLNKAGQLSSEEFNQIKMHPYISAQILKPVPLFKNIVPSVYHHHERWDGRGYPDGLKGEGIPLGARILAVADSFDAMIADRVYRRGKGKDAAANELVKCAAGQFDPRVVDALLTALEKQIFEEKSNSGWKFDNLSNVFRDVLDAVSSGQLVISDNPEIGRLKQQGEKLGEASVQIPEDIGRTRQSVKDCLQKYKVPEQEINKILLCISEVTTNILKHASGGRLLWYFCNDGKIRFIAEDSGPGIKLSDLPKATLVKGTKKEKSLGLGFTVLLELMNKVYLKTDEQGTTLVLEQEMDCGVKTENKISKKIS